MSRVRGSPARNFPPFVKYESIVPIDNAGSLDSLIAIHPQLEVYEKLDGGNCQVSCVDYQLFPASRSRYLSGKYIERRPWFPKFVGWTWSNPSLHNLPDNLVVFGEWTGNHTIQYSPEHNDNFFVIDVFDRNSGKVVPYAQGRDLLESLHIENVHYLEELGKGNVSVGEIDRLVNEEPSAYYDGPKEGIVLKSYLDSEKITRAWKFLHPSFSESRQRVFGGKQIVDHLTPARFVKAYFRLGDSGNQEVVSATDLCIEVCKDVQKERDVSYSLGEVTDRFQKLASKNQLNKIILSQDFVDR